MTDLTEAHGDERILSPFNAVKLVMPGYTARVWTGLNALTIEGESFIGAGKLLGLGAVGGSIEGGAQRPAITWTTTDAIDLDELSDYVVQGSEVFIWFGQLNRETGNAKGVRRVFAGRIDQPRITKGAQNRIEIRCMGAREYAKRRDPRRWNPGDQESVFAGDEYFKYSDDSGLNFPFGNADAPNPRGGVRGGSSGGGGGGGFLDDFGGGFSSIR